MRDGFAASRLMARWRFIIFPREEDDVEASGMMAGYR